MLGTRSSQCILVEIKYILHAGIISTNSQACRIKKPTCSCCMVDKSPLNVLQKSLHFLSLIHTHTHSLTLTVSLSLSYLCVYPLLQTMALVLESNHSSTIWWSWESIFVWISTLECVTMGLPNVLATRNGDSLSDIPSSNHVPSFRAWLVTLGSQRILTCLD